MSLPSCKPFLAISFCPISPMLCAISPSIQWLANPTTLFLFFIFNASLFASLLYIAHLSTRVCLIFNISLFASLLYIAHLFARLCLIFNNSLLVSLLYIAHLFARVCLIFNISLLASLLYIAHLFARHLVANLYTVSNICCRARLCPRAYFCQHRISIPCIARSMGSFPISLCRHKVKHLLFSTPTFEIENLVKRRNRPPLPPSSIHHTLTSKI